METKRHPSDRWVAASSLLAGTIGIGALIATVPSPELFLRPRDVLLALTDGGARLRYQIHFGFLAVGALLAIPPMNRLRVLLRGHAPVLGLAGFVAITLGLLAFAYGSLVNLVVFPGLGSELEGGAAASEIFRTASRTQDHTLAVVAFVGLGFLLGMLALAVASLRSRVGWRITGILGLVAALIHLGVIAVGLLFPDSLPPIEETWGWAPQLPEAPLALWFVVVGLDLFRERPSLA